jgi:hypothetical protein
MISQFGWLQALLSRKFSSPAGWKHFLPCLSELRQEFDYHGQSILIFNAHSIRVTPCVIQLCGTRKIIIRLISHLLDFVQPLDLCALRLSTIIDRKENQGQGMKGDTRKIDRAQLLYYKRMAIPMVRWSFERGDCV